MSTAAPKTTKKAKVSKPAAASDVKGPSLDTSVSENTLKVGVNIEAAGIVAAEIPDVHKLETEKIKLMEEEKAKLEARMHELEEALEKKAADLEKKDADLELMGRAAARVVELEATLERTILEHERKVVEFDSLSSAFSLLNARLAKAEQKPPPPSKLGISRVVKPFGVMGDTRTQSEISKDLDNQRAFLNARPVRSKTRIHRPGKVLPTLDEFVRPAENTSKTRFTKKVLSYYLAGRLKEKKVYFSLPDTHNALTEKRSARLPEKQLSLDYVYGYNGRDYRSNCWFGKTKDTSQNIVFAAASLGVVMDTQNQQSFLQGHQDMVSSLALHPTESLVVMGQADVKNRAASFVSVWNYQSCKELARIKYCSRGVELCRFDANGGLIYVLGLLPDRRVLAAFDWRQLTLEAGGESHVPLWAETLTKDAHVDLVFNPFMTHGLSEFATVGKQFKLWMLDGDALHTALPTSFESTGVVQKCYYSCVWASREMCFVAAHSGDVYLFQKGELLKFFNAHPAAVTCVLFGDCGLITASSDLKIKIFDRASALARPGDAAFVPAKETFLTSPGGHDKSAVPVVTRSEVALLYSLDISGLPGPAVRIVHALDYSTQQRRVLVAMKDNAVFEVDLTQLDSKLSGPCSVRLEEGKHVRVRVQGHARDVSCLDTCAKYTEFVSCSNELNVWNYVTHRRTRHAQLSKPVRCCALSGSALYLACGREDSCVLLFAFDSLEMLRSKKLVGNPTLRGNATVDADKEKEGSPRPSPPRSPSKKGLGSLSPRRGAGIGRNSSPERYGRKEKEAFQPFMSGVEREVAIQPSKESSKPGSVSSVVCSCPR
jgi:WD40 repeat protein